MLYKTNNQKKLPLILVHFVFKGFGGRTFYNGLSSSPRAETFHADDSFLCGFSFFIFFHIRLWFQNVAKGLINIALQKQ